MTDVHLFACNYVPIAWASSFRDATSPTGLAQRVMHVAYSLREAHLPVQPISFRAYPHIWKNDLVGTSNC